MSPLNQSHYLKYLIVAGFVHVLYGPLCYFYLWPNSEPLLARLPVLILYIFGFVLYKYYIKNPKTAEYMIYAWQFAATIHYYYLVHLSNYHPYYIMGMLVMILGCASFIFNKKALCYYFLLILPLSLFVIQSAQIDYPKHLLSFHFIAFSTLLFGFQYEKIKVFTKLDNAYLEIKHSKQQVENTYSKNLQAAHDLASPLSAINTVASFIEKENNKLYHLLKTSIVRINEITNELLSTHKSNRRTFESDFFDLESSISQIINEKRNEYPETKNLFILYRLSSPLLDNIHIPKSEFQRVLSNLINNSVDATIDKEETHIRITITPCDQYVEVFIEDNGHGIDKNHQSEIFLENVSFKNNGTGIGLSYAKKTIESWQGSLSLISSSKQGSVFRIIIPYNTNPDNTLLKI